MPLSQETIDLLRDEAYLALNRQTLTAAIKAVSSRIKQLKESRPPFGVLASRKTRDAFEAEMQTANENELTFKSRLAKAEMLENWVKQRLRPSIHDYLCGASVEYQRGNDVRLAFDRLIVQVDRYPEYLQAFARDLRALIKVLATGGGRVALAHTRADLRKSAETLDCQALQLEIAGQRIIRAAEGSLFSEIKIHQPAFKAQSALVDQLTKLDDSEAQKCAHQAETEARTFLADGLHRLRTAAEASRSRISHIESDYLEKYWQELRTHAQTHYVEDRDLTEVLHELTERYVGHRQHEESVAHDPLIH
ncbi:MAG TPA: hypothetical protein VKC60_17835 [Opitutaceae bacterium]|nr:hypothetical protein [Opitutaceae bacterium]